MMLHRLVFAALFVLTPLVAQGRCEVDSVAVGRAVTLFSERAAQQPLPLPLDTARCFRQEFVAKLGTSLGGLVGYKVGLYTAAGRKTFGASAPEIGVLLQGMLLDAAKPISASLGYSPIAEADFVLVVGDERINEAQTREEFYLYLRGYRPFIELPDNHYPSTIPVSVGQLVALNVNARAAVVGEERVLPAGLDGIDALSNLTVTMTVDGQTRRQLSGKSLETLGDPLDIAIFARDAVRREGGRLRVGEMISIGALVTPHPPRAGERFHVLYRLGDEVSEIAVRFGD